VDWVLVNLLDFEMVKLWTNNEQIMSNYDKKKS